MDISEYLPMFLAESSEHLQELNLAIVRIEESPDDTATIDEIFRIAHSFKGMSATMGFEGIAALTHRMEDVFELLRQRNGGLERSAIDVLLECMDALSAAVDRIETEGAENLDPSALIARLDHLVRSPEPVEPAAPADHGLSPVVLDAIAAGERVLRVSVRFVEDIAMPSVRAYMVLASLGEHGDLLGSDPTEEQIDTFDGKGVLAWLLSEHEEGVIAAAAADVADVETVDVTEVPVSPTADEQLPVAQPPVPEVLEAAPAADGSFVAVTDAAPGTSTAAAPVAAADPAADADAKPVKAAHGQKRSGGMVRVDAERLDQLMHLMGELVVHRTHLEALAAQSDVPGLSQAMQDVTRSSQALQAMVMQVRMIPVEAVFLRFPRLVRDLSTKLEKKIELKLVGQDTELDRTVVDAIGDPLVHLVRNSLDHGIEPPAERLAAGKPEVGTLEMSARHAGSNVLITVRDDGRGVNPAKVAEKAAQKGLITEDQIASIDAAKAIELLFHPGFSTAEVTSDISGRGVGMDAVRATIRELGGEVVMHSEPGQGTVSQIRLPLTLAIMPALVVGIAGDSYAIPLDRVERILSLREHVVRSMGGSRMLLLDDGVLPLCDGGDVLAPHGPDGTPVEHAVLIRGADNRRMALGVHGLDGQRELVTRPLPSELGGRAFVSGGAVLANGDITLIVDCDALVDTGAGPAAAPLGLPTATA